MLNTVVDDRVQCFAVAARIMRRILIVPRTRQGKGSLIGRRGCLVAGILIDCTCPPPAAGSQSKCRVRISRHKWVTRLRHCIGGGSRLIEMVPGVLPPGAVEPEPVVYVQVILDQQGRVARPQYLGGPRSLYPAALEALAKWRTQPIRVNGAPVVTPNVAQVPFK